MQNRPGLLGNGVDRDAGNPESSKGFRVGRTHLFEIYCPDRQLHPIRSPGEGLEHRFIRMRCPNFRRSEAQGVEVDHAVHDGPLLLGQLGDVEFGTDHSLFFRSETDEHEGVLPRLRAETVQQAGQKGRPAPVIHHAVTHLDMIGVRADQNDAVGLARQDADNVGRELFCDPLFGEMVWFATGSDK